MTAQLTATTSRVELATVERAQEYAEAARAAETLRGYRSDWRQFTRWCTAHQVEALPATPETVVCYLADRAGILSVATLGRHLTSIAAAHNAVGEASPVGHEGVRTTWRGIRRTFGTASKGKAPLTVDDIRAMISTLDPANPQHVRDRAMFLIGFAGALRRSELVALDVEDVTDTDDGLVVLIRRSKTDQEGRGATIGLPYGSDPATCPVRAYRAHLTVSGITTGPLFRPTRGGGDRLTGRAVAERLQRLASAIGRDATDIGAHSLRAGLITAAARANVSERDIMRHSRHKSIHVFRSYVRDITLFESNAAAAVGL